MFKRLNKKIIAFFLLCVSLVFTLSSYIVVKADEMKTVYTDVLEDLQKDENFKKESYIVDGGTHSIDLFQIAESSEKELFLYFFQSDYQVRPISLTGINMLTEASSGFDLYDLELLSFSEGFYKCIVKDFKVSEETIRIYNISTFYRGVEDFDEKDDLTTEIGYKGKKFIAKTIDSKVYYSINSIETIEVTGQYVGFIRYYDNSLFGKGGADYIDYDSFFLGFSTKEKIANLISAEVEAYVYSRTDVQAVYMGFIKAPNDKKDSITKPEKKEFTVTRGVNDTYKTPGLLASKEYTWNQIQTPEEFVKEENLTIKNGVDIYEYDWILRFFNAPYITESKTFLGFGNIFYTRYCVEKVTAVSLTFKSNNAILTLGVVANKQNSSGAPSGTVGGDSFLEEMYEKLKSMFSKTVSLILLVLIVVVILSIILTLVPGLLPMIGKAFIWLVKGVIWVILLPFKLICKLFKRKEKK